MTLNHQKLDVYTASRRFIYGCYRLTKQLPAEEEFSMCSQIRRAALSVHLNIAEGASRKSEQEHYVVARGSLVAIDAALDIAKELLYSENVDTEALGQVMLQTFKILTGLINSSPH